MSSHYKGRTVLIVSTVIIFSILISMSVLLTAERSDDIPDFDVKVIDFYPRGIVDRPTNITVKFSNKLVPDDSLDKVTADIPFEFDPPISGLARWMDNDEIRFFPDTMFAPSTIYKIKFGRDKPYINGNRINEDKIFEFRTPVFIVENVSIQIIDVPDNPAQNKLLIYIDFNYNVDYNELLEHVKSSLKSDDNYLKFSANDQSPSARFGLVSDPFRPQKTRERVNFIITKGLNCIGGQIPLQADFKKEFIIHKPRPLVVERVIPEEAGKNGRILVQLSQLVALADLKEFLSITPDVKITLDQRHHRTYLYGNFKPGEVYTVEIKRGLSSTNGQYLESDFSTKVQMPNLKPSLRFLDDGFYMSKESSRLLALETINVNEITIEVEQVFVNNIVYYLNVGRRNYYYKNINKVGRKIFAKDFVISSVLNEPTVSTFNLGEVVEDSLQGIYSISIRRKDRRWNYSQRRIMITDLGILARLSDNYLMVWVNSLKEGQPIKKADIRLFSANNQVLLEGKTNSDGVAIFKDIGAKLEGFIPFVITISKGHDLSYLKFSECLLPSAEFDIKGRPYLIKGYETFIYSDRGVYRPGETVHLINVVRDKNGVIPGDFPYKLYVNDPQGRNFKQYKLTTSDGGIEAIDIDIPSFAKTGAYHVSAKIGENIIGQYSFQVEEFIPDRIKTTVTVDKDYYDTGEELQIIVNGMYLFGTPCEGNKVNGNVIIEPDIFQPKDWREYSFIDPVKQFTQVSADLQTEALDENGNHVYTYSIPVNLNPPSGLKMLISSTVMEDGGRAVSDYKGVVLHAYPIYLGLRKNYEGYAKVGEDIEYSVLSVNKSGDIVATDSVWAKIYRIIYQTIVKKDKQGTYRYISEEQEQIIDSVLVSISERPEIIKYTPVEYGSYRLRLFSPHTDHTSAATFYVSGWGYAPWSMTNPDRLDLELDAYQYEPGQIAKMLVKAPFEGKLLLTIEKDEVLHYKTYDLEGNMAEIDFEVLPEYAPNVYISATLIKSITSLERFSPVRAFGLIPLAVQNNSVNLDIDLEAPSLIKPKQEIEIKIKSRPNAKLTVAAVDVGILQLTDFSIPDPFQFFYGKRCPSLNAYDIYTFIFPDIEPAKSMLSAAGDAGLYEARRKRHVSPVASRRVKPVALWSGLFETDSLGNAMIKFNIPQFNGKLKIMAVGFNKERCGSAVSEILVKDKILIQESLPRFVSTGDKVEAKVVVFNDTGKDEKISITMDIYGAAKLESDKTVSPYIIEGGKAMVQFTFRADNKPGNITFNISATAGDEKSDIKVELPNRPPQPLLTRHGSGIVKDGQPVEIAMPSDWLEGTAEYELRLSSLPTVRLSRSIQYLLSYPYGCLEQTTSKLFPMLYYNDIARFVQPSLTGSKGIEYFIEEGLIKIISMQLPSGGFSYWPGSGHSNHWASIYACHFQVEARKAGYYISDNVYSRILRYLKKTANDVSLENNLGVLRIYASYVLALAGELDRGTLEGLKYLNLDKIPLYSRFQYGGAIALTKTPEDALWLIPIEIHPETYEPETGGFFNSSIRANAILLDILTELAPDNPSIPVLLETISEDLHFGRWYTTQSTAWSLMAIGKFLKSQEDANYKGTVVVDGRRYRDFSVENVQISDSSLGNKEIEISISGKGNCYYYWQASGVSTEKKIHEYDNRLKVRREHFDINGNPLDINSIKLGDQVVAKITAIALDKNLDNVIISDLLPACLEIENPRLVTSGRMSRIRNKSTSPDYMDIRDDRMLLFANINMNRQFEYYYSLRVVATGEFIVPAVAAECMYDPTIRSAGSSGNITVLD